MKHNKFSWLFVFLGVLFLGTLVAYAQTDMGEVVTEVAGYWTAVKAVAIGIVLFVLGRRVLRKL